MRQQTGLRGAENQSAAPGGDSRPEQLSYEKESLERVKERQELTPFEGREPESKQACRNNRFTTMSEDRFSSCVRFPIMHETASSAQPPQGGCAQLVARRQPAILKDAVSSSDVV